jgi:hypothetical protein
MEAFQAILKLASKAPPEALLLFRFGLCPAVDAGPSDEGPLSGDVLRAMRCIEVLECMGSPRAKELLQRLAKGKPEHRLTRDAAKALNRLEKIRRSSR